MNLVLNMVLKQKKRLIKNDFGVYMPLPQYEEELAKEGSFRLTSITWLPVDGKWISCHGYWTGVSGFSGPMTDSSKRHNTERDAILYALLGIYEPLRVRIPDTKREEAIIKQIQNWCKEIAAKYNLTL